MVSGLAAEQMEGHEAMDGNQGVSALHSRELPILEEALPTSCLNCVITQVLTLLLRAHDAQAKMGAHISDPFRTLYCSNWLLLPCSTH